jgi:hypothetical protein
MRVVVAGGTGLVGSAVVEALATRGDTVTVLTRDPSRVGTRERKAARYEAYDPTAPGDWQKLVDGQDAVLHLAGERAVGRRLSTRVKRDLTASRVTLAERLVEAMTQASAKPSVFVCASAVGYYGFVHGTEPLDESAPPGDDFFADLCVRWETVAREAEPLGVRVVRTRFGIVLAKGAPSLFLMTLPYRLFVGGPVGNGRQIFSWVHLDDAVRMVLRCIDDSAFNGAVNVTAPGAASYEELSLALGGALRRPSWFRVPGFAVELLLGEASGTILGGQRAVPTRMLEAGFVWEEPELRAALKACLD